MSVKEGVYWIRNLQDNKVLDLSEGKVTAGTKVLNFNQLETFNVLLNQLWIVERFASRDKYIIRNVHSNLVLDLEAARSNNGTPIVCWTRHAGANQQWRLEWNKDVDGTAYYHITSVGASKAISHTPNGALNYAVGWTVDNNDSKQLWAFTPFIHPLTYRLRVKSTDRVLDLSQASSANGTLALAYGQHTATTKRNQLWWLPIKPGNEGYTIQCLETSTVADMRTSDNGIIGWRSHGGRNQQWKMNTLDDGYQEITNVFSGLVMDAMRNDEIKRVAGYESHGGENQQWFLDPVSSPGPGWVLLQNGGTGKFLSSDPSGNIGTSDGPVPVYNESVQWRFLQKDYTGIYTLVNRATGAFLRQLSSQPSISLVKTTENEACDWWILENYKNSDAGLISIISKETNNTLDHLAGQTVDALDTGTDHLNRAWRIMSANDWITSFALLNGETGHSLAVQTGSEQATVSAENAVKNFDAQWVFRKIADGPLFSIQNKANNQLVGWQSARWELVVSRDKYFGLRDTTTGKYLGAENGEASFQAADLTGRPEAWELVPDWTLDGLHDVIEAVLPLLTNGDVRAQIGENIDQRAAKKPAKDVSEWRLPRRVRFKGVDNPTVRQLLHALIDRWEWDVVNEQTQAQTQAQTQTQTLISFDLAMAETVITGQRLPQSIRRVYDTSAQPATVFQLTRHNAVTVNGTRYATLQGRYGADTYFHLALPLGTTFGREQIRGFLRDSLEDSTTVVVTPTTCKPPADGPALRSAGAGGSRNSWVGWARALLAGTG